ncbi:hypothetical protein J2Y69_003104 [Microbacterium resistens]|uniref:Uncharacterized protein n=1 Tax=Microbacterium resistens TaxID=156977 RepID=A0ABU1SFV8_9MICO|nr:hypothetical protein [Microbacterium resistens]MDR6868485.1 hypothetical protein [Microbacterium resistens]
MQFPPGYALCSFVVPRTADGAAAIRVIGEQNAQLVGEAVGADGVHLSVVPVGPDMLATVMSSAIPSALQRERILKLLVSRQAPDTLVSAVVERERQMSSYSRTWERDALALGPDQDVSISGTRSALATAWSSLRLFTEPGMAAPPGFGEAIPPLAPAVGVRFRSRAGQDRIDVGPHHITSLRRGATRHGASRTSDDIENVDLEDLSLVLEDASGSLMLIDGQFRVLDVAVDVYRGSKRLRQLLDERTTGAPRLRVSNAANPGPMRERVKARRRLIWTLVLAPLGILAFAWIMSILDDTIQGTPNGSADSSYVSTALPWA